MLLSFADDRMPTTREGVAPNAPTLNDGDFGVKLINGQVSDSPAMLPEPGPARRCARS